VQKSAQAQRRQQPYGVLVRSGNLHGLFAGHQHRWNYTGIPAACKISGFLGTSDMHALVRAYWPGNQLLARTTGSLL
jgi:hypothetical protein